MEVIMYYKVLKDGRVIDVLDRLVYLRYQPKHQIMLLCSEAKAQAILGSDGDTVWHEATLFQLPVEGYDTVRVEEIDAYEYRQLKALNGKTPEQIIDEYTLLLIQEGVI